jgi:hypothetical protein
LASCNSGGDATDRDGDGPAPFATPRKEYPMLDLVLLAAGLAFFALSIAYAFGCERL